MLKVYWIIMGLKLLFCDPRFSSLNLTPDESPEMSFQADARSLRQAITSFGTISTQVCGIGIFIFLFLFYYGKDLNSSKSQYFQPFINTYLNILNLKWLKFTFDYILTKPPP